MSGRPIILWGATGQAKVLAEFLPAQGYEIVALFDSNPQVESPLRGTPLYRGWEGFEAWRTRSGVAEFLVAVGGARGADRISIFERLASAGLRSTVAIHPSATVLGGATLGAGCQILAGSVIGAEASLGISCIINTKASVDHECVLGKGVHVAPGATLCGLVNVDDGAFIGAGAVVLPRLRIGREAIVGAGAVVTKDVAPGVTVRGNPARATKNVE